MKKAQEITQRIVALFLSSALAIITGSSVINSVSDSDITLWQSAALAGFAAVAKVVEQLAKSAVDGTLTRDEIDQAFGGQSPAKKQAKRLAK
ncbi:hypothetical protein UFOVP1566_47 [uncultured Caudovirales phage]|jgi:hypothetical protein|uniref:Holin n=1 Tax=uncultured Caudovirales phage TaxID=2100421 RepID=A0A6J5S648_9CAUD|nr:hypothetical protein UFOVP1389_17 [uncultured Caudovirales phage]CAB5230178.1 hypothetical protein UFOVP1566_47 [uncultured Caudovirales phage]